MAAISRKDRWWKTRVSESESVGCWYSIGTDKKGLDLAAMFCRSRPLGIDHQYPEIPFQAADGLITSLGGCTQCRMWDPGAVHEPIDAVVDATNKKQCTVSKRYTDRLWVSSAVWVACSIVHRSLLESLLPYVSPDLVVGDVFVRGGDQLHDLALVCDPSSPAVRTRYAKEFFCSSPSVHGWAPCHTCGRLLLRQNMWAQYLLSSEHSERYVRFYHGNALVPPEVLSACGFDNPDKWRGMSIRPVPEFEFALDPMPSPIPTNWDELEKRFGDIGYSLPFPKVCRFDLKPDWIEERAKRLGEDACRLDATVLNRRVDCETIASIFFEVRMRALFEERVGKKIDGWDDQRLLEYLVELYVATGGLAQYPFPI